MFDNSPTFQFQGRVRRQKSTRVPKGMLNCVSRLARAFFSKWLTRKTDASSNDGSSSTSSASTGTVLHTSRRDKPRRRDMKIAQGQDVGSTLLSFGRPPPWGRSFLTNLSQRRGWSHFVNFARTAEKLISKAFRNLHFDSAFRSRLPWVGAVRALTRPQTHATRMQAPLPKLFRTCRAERFSSVLHSTFNIHISTVLLRMGGPRICLRFLAARVASGARNRPFCSLLWRQF